MRARARRDSLYAVRLLVVEDELRLGAALRRGLTAEGMVVDVATNGPRGLEAARHGDYDAVVLDVMLPGMSGYDVVRTLRKEENWVPVLMLSAKDGEYDQADGLDYGADDYLTKPFSFVVLLARLRALVRRTMPARPSILTVGDLTLDPAHRSAVTQMDRLRERRVVARRVRIDLVVDRAARQSYARFHVATAQDVNASG